MTSHWLLVWAILVVTLGPMAYEAIRGRFDFCDLKNGFLGYYALVLGFSSILTLRLGTDAGLGLDIAGDPDTYLVALGLAAAGAAAFQIGYYARPPRPLALAPLLKAPWRRARVPWLVGAFFLVGFASFALLLRENGGLAAFLRDRSGWRSAGVIGQGYLLFPATALLAIASHLFLLASAAQGPPTARRRIFCLMLYGVALVPPFLLGFRSLIVSPILQLLLIWHARVAPLRFAKLAVAAGVLGVGFTVYGITREIPPDVSVDADQVQTLLELKPALAYNLLGRVRGVEILATVMKRLGETREFDLSFDSVVEAATIMIPGRLWSEKPQASNVRFTTYFFGNDFQRLRGTDAETFGGVSPTVTGELYWHLGVGGVVIGLFLMGMLARLLYATLLRNERSDGVLLGYAMCYTAFAFSAEHIQGYLNGFILTAIALTATYFLLAVRTGPEPERSFGSIALTAGSGNAV